MPRPHKSTNVRLRNVRRVLRAAGRVAPGLAARGLEALFLRVRRHPPPERERAWLEGARPITFSSRGKRLHAWSWGADDAPTVLLAHGWEGRSSQMGAFVRPLLASCHRVVAFDAPGHGRSPGKRSSVVEMVDAVFDAGRHLGPLHAIVAHSAGAAASTVALGRGLGAGRLVFLAPPVELEAFLDQVAAYLGLPGEVARLAQERIEKRLGVRWESLRTLPLAREMRAPLLVLHDEADREVPFTNGVRLAEAWPGARLKRTSGLGHRRILRDPAVVAEAVAFLRGEAPAQEVASWGAASGVSASSTAGARATPSFPSSFA